MLFIKEREREREREGTIQTDDNFFVFVKFEIQTVLNACYSNTFDTAFICKTTFAEN